MKIYGNEKTHLTLSDKAQAYYDVTDPLRIEEYETDDGYIYNITGCFDRYGMTEEEVNRVLESLADAVVNEYGVEIDFDTAVNLMDDELRERISSELAPCTGQEFFDAYCQAHEEKYGEPWELAKANPVY